MKEFWNVHGTCCVDNQNVFFVDGKEKVHNVKNVTYMEYKRNTYAYIEMYNGTYKIYGLKENKILLSNISRIVHKAKSFVIVTFRDGNKEKYYLYHFIDETKSRYITKFVNDAILEKDGITLNIVKPTRDSIILPQKCKDLCKGNDIIGFYAITTSNEILVLAPYPYNFNLKSNSEEIIFWKLKKYLKYKILKNLSFDSLVELIDFENEDDKKLFKLVTLLYKHISEKVYDDNIEKILSKKQITFREAKFKVCLTLNKIILEHQKEKFEYDYNVFEYDKFYLQELLLYHTTRGVEERIKYWANKKTLVSDIIGSNSFSGNDELLKRYLYNLNCNPNCKYFYIINGQNRLVLVDRKKFIGGIKNALNEGKSFLAIAKRYDLNPYIIKRIFKDLYPTEYNYFKDLMTIN